MENKEKYSLIKYGVSGEDLRTGKSFQDEIVLKSGEIPSFDNSTSELKSKYRNLGFVVTDFRFIDYVIAEIDHSVEFEKISKSKENPN